MNRLRFTLVSEGSSDRALIPVLIWAIQQHAEVDIQPRWAELRQLADPPKSLVEKIQVTLELYPCDLLFIHRDADRAGRETRAREIEAAMAAAHQDPATSPPAVCVIPVRALEAWFLFDEQALRHASGNPNGKTPLNLPGWQDIESLSDPKTQLEGIIRAASELEGRRRRRIEAAQAVHRIADLVRDFSPLRNLSAFRAFEEDLRRLLVRGQNTSV